MLSKECIEKIVFMSDSKSIANFAILAIEHLKKAYPYNDNVVNNALELVIGAAKPYTIDSIDIAKVEEQVKKQCYKAENAENICIKDVDSISLEVEVEYKNPDDKYNSSCRIDIADVLKEK